MPFDVDLSRRAFVTTALTSGFALAAGPVAADTVIHTDDAGQKTETVQLKTTNGPLPAYVAEPAKGGPFPVVLVVQEIFGVHEHIKDVCRRFAKLGAMAIAPELFARHADVTKMADVQEILRSVVTKIDDAQVLSDLDSAVAWAESTGRAAKKRLAITGFCWGGRIVWLYAAHNPQVSAGVAWYGKLVGDASSRQPKQPIDIAKDLKVPVLGLYGGADTGIPQDTIDKMKAALKDGKSKSEIVVFPDTPHAFFADYRPSYRQGPAEQGWNRLKDWFKKNGVLKG
jgi:carboxymethylenebutenolidase